MSKNFKKTEKLEVFTTIMGWLALIGGTFLPLFIITQIFSEDLTKIQYGVGIFTFMYTFYAMMIKEGLMIALKKQDYLCTPLK